LEIGFRILFSKKIFSAENLRKVKEKSFFLGFFVSSWVQFLNMTPHRRISLDAWLISTFIGVSAVQQLKVQMQQLIHCVAATVYFCALAHLVALISQ
jgi:hypothetical protein